MEPPRDPRIGLFTFGEIEVDATKSGSKWHLRSGGYEVTADHLGAKG